MADTGAKYEGGRAGGRVSRPGGCKGGTLNLKFSNFPFFPSLWSLAAYPLPPPLPVTLSGDFWLLSRLLVALVIVRGNEGKKR